MEDEERAPKTEDKWLEEPKISPNHNGKGAASVLQEKSENLEKRRVSIVTVPVKDIGPIRRAVIKLVSWAVGSPLTWAMHWAICIDDTYFELQRPRGLAKPRLAVTTWPEEKKKEIIMTCPISSTLMTNEEIIVASQAYFTENRMWYDVFSNNCQLFVKFSLKRIASEVPEFPTPMTSSFENTITVILALTIQLVSLPFVTVYLRWLRWRGCDQYNLQAYAALSSIFVGLAGSVMLMFLSQSYYILAAPIYSEQKWFVGVLASFQSATFVFSTIFSSLIIFIPRARQRKDGTWAVSTIMIQSNEGTLDSEVAIKKGIPVLAILLGGFIGLSLWTYIAIPFLIIQCFKALHEHLSFRSPGRFTQSLWKLLMMPLIEFDSDNMKKDDPDAAETENSKERVH